MSRLVVMALFDVQRRLRPHTLRAVQDYSAAADRVIVVSTSGAEDAAAQLPPSVEFVTRENFGYDFYSYKWGLDVAGDLGQYSQILICNDTFVGPTVPTAEIFDSPQARAVDVMGMTYSHHHGGHVQSFFMLVNGFVAGSQAFRRFWKDLEPVSDRMAVIQRYEVGFSRAMAAAGFSLGAYFQPTAEEEALARRRYHWFTTHRLDLQDPSKVIADVHRFNLDGKPWNPAVAFADRILDDSRLPLLKFDTLRFDPYALGADDLLAACVAREPEHFGEVREFLDATRENYPVRPGEKNLPVTRQELRRKRIGYLLDEATTATGAPAPAREEARHA
ncbi:hypothetical protein GCM10027060_17180 [Nesterenkonia halophila]|uniref:rhamnan synthesis F family protein n=1 Tax=Nesterenkonia halophila TaxID=302044 RepID=UPI001291CDF3|nr:rhamnan synthesis F family protein [Nesterenkonia halophila]